MYVITGASGNTGKRIALALLAAGQSVVAVSRKKENINELLEKGAKAAIGDLQDQAFLEQTFAGAKAVYAMIPPNTATTDFRGYQRAVGATIAQAVEKNKVPYVVLLSSFGADINEETGVLLGLYDLEQRLNAIEGLNAFYLRPGFFFENFFGMTATIEPMGIMGGFPIKADLKLPMIHTQDIAQVATEKLLKLDFSGKQAAFLAAEKDYTLSEAVAILGKAMGKPNLPYVQFPYDQALQGMIGAGFQPDLANHYVNFSKALNENERLMAGYSSGVLIRTPTSLEDFAPAFAAALAH